MTDKNHNKPGITPLLLLAASLFLPAGTALSGPQPSKEELYSKALARALHAARGIQDNDERDWSLAVIAKGQAEVGHAQAAVDTAHEIDAANLRGHVLRVAAEKLLDEEGIDAALGVAREIEDAAARPQALRNIAEAQAKEGNVQGALATAGSIIDPAARAIALSDIAEAVAKRGGGEAASEHIELAVKTAGEIPSHAEQAQALNEIAKAQLAVNGLDASRSLFDRARQIAWEVPNSVARARVLYLIGKGRSQTEDIEGAFKDAEKLPDPLGRAFVLREIGMEYGSAGKTGEARSAFGKAATHAVQIEDPAKRSRMIGKVAEATVDRAGDIEWALSLAEKAPDSDGKDLVLSMLIGALAEEANTERALDVARGIESAPVRAIARIDIAKAAIESGDRSGALDILADVRAEDAEIFAGDYRPRLYRELAEAYAKSGDFDSAFDAAGEIDLPVERATAYSAIAEVLKREEKRRGPPHKR